MSDFYREQKLRMLEILKELKEGVIYEPSCGICFQVVTQTEFHATPIMEELFERWPKYTGSIAYPICTNKRIGGSDQYDNAKEKGTMWSNTPYGKARKELVNFMIEELEKELNL